MNVVVVIASAFLGLGALFSLVRIIRGPRALDRIVASDTLLATAMCGLGIEMAVNRHTNTLPVLLVLAVFAVVGSVSVARFLSREETG